MEENKKYSWSKFTKLPLIETYLRNAGKPIEIEEGQEIVTLIKSMDYFMSMLRIGNGVNYLGSSRGYVLEKIGLLEQSLDWLKDRVKENY